MFTTSFQGLYRPVSRIVLKSNLHVTRLFSIYHPKQQSSSSEEEHPTGLKATSGIELLTFGTPNGHKASIILEELKAAYDLPYTFQSINIMENIQKQPWYTALCPNGRIPVIVDHDRGGFAVFEGSAILSYLTRHYDTEKKFSFDVTREPDLYSQAEQWVAFQHGGIGPMQGQANHFYRLAKERIPYPTQRYLGETERLYGVLEKRLEGREYLVGEGQGKFSIADVANFSWVNVSYFAGVDLAQFKGLESWWKRIAERPAVKKGVEVPTASRLGNEAFLRRLEEEPEFREKEDELKELGNKAKEQYGYKYSSP